MPATMIRWSVPIVMVLTLFLAADAVADYDGKAVLYNNRGVDYTNRGAIEDAIESFQKAIETDPAYPDPYYNLGTIYYESNQIDPAQNALEQAVKMKPDYAEARFQLGLIYARKNLQDKAIAEYEAAIRYNARLAGPYYSLGVLHNRRGNYSVARDLLKKAVDINPEDIKAVNALCVSVIELGDLAMAQELVTQARELESDNPELYLNMGNLAAAQGDFEGAQSHYDKARNLRPKVWPSLVLSTGVSWIKARDPEKGRPYIEEALKYKETQARACYYMGILRIGSNKGEANSYLQQAVKLEDGLADKAAKDPLWEPLRSDPVFRRTARMNEPLTVTPVVPLKESPEPIFQPTVKPRSGPTIAAPVKGKKKMKVPTLTPTTEKKGLLNWFKIKLTPTPGPAPSKTKKNKK